MKRIAITIIALMATCGLWGQENGVPVCSPRFRASASVIVQQAAFATGVPPNIYAFHRYTRNSVNLSSTQERQFQMQFQG